MKHFLTVWAVACFGWVAHADTTWTSKTTDVYYSSAYSFYSCDFAEARVRDILSTLGARNIQTDCAGGIPYDRQVDVNASFEVVTSGGTWTPVTYSNNDQSCEFTQQVFEQVLPSFTTRNVNESGGCWNGQGNVNDTLEVLK